MTGSLFPDGRPVGEWLDADDLAVIGEEAAQESGSLFDDVPEVRQALYLLLGGGLNEDGKRLWLNLRVEEGMTPEAIFADALGLMDA